MSGAVSPGLSLPGLSIPGLSLPGLGVLSAPPAVAAAPVVTGYTTDIENIFKFSLYKRIESFLTDTTIWSTEFNVYTEDDYKDSAGIADPFCFILDSQVVKRFVWLPVIIVETGMFEAVSFELGDDYGFMGAIFSINVIDLTRTGRESIMGKWIQTVRDIPLIDPATGETAVNANGDALASKLLPVRDRDTRLWLSQYERLPSDPQIYQGSATNWSIATARVLIN